MSTLTRKKVLQILKSAQEKGRRPDLSGADLRGVDLSGMYFGGAYFIGTKLDGANLSQANFTGANLSRADLNKAHLQGAKLGAAYLSQANLGQANLIGAQLSRTHLVGADLSGTILFGAHLSQTDLSGADLSGASLSGADLSEASLIWANFSDADLSHTNLSEADFSEACLTGTNLCRADLSGADLFKADLSGANLNRANLLWVDLRQAILFEADLTHANFSRAKLNEADFTGAMVGLTTFADVDMSEVKGLDSVIHHAPSTLGVDTLSRSRGQIPATFLRGCGLSELQLETAKFNNPHITFEQIISITTSIQEWLVEPAFSACFISYVRSDEVFAQQLHNDLQQLGIRCWLAIAKGDDIGQSATDDPIRYHDKLLLLLSKHSMGNAWIREEVETGLKEEDRRSETVIFPLYLDNTTTEAGPTWMSKLRQSRPTADFSRWQNSKSYQQALTRLLQDLLTKKE